MESIIRSEPLVRLELGGNSLASPQFSLLCDAITSSKTLKIIDLSHNDLEDINLYELASRIVFSQNSSLQDINLKGIDLMVGLNSKRKSAFARCIANSALHWCAEPFNQVIWL